MYRKSAAILLLASLTDALLTDWGLRLHAVTEANPVMRMLYEQAYPLFYGVKLLLPFFLLLIPDKPHPKKYQTVLIGTAFAVYTGVLLLHSRWMWLNFL